MKRTVLLLIGSNCLAAGRAFAQAQTPPITPTLANVSYGPHARNVLDFYRAESKTPAPLIVYDQASAITHHSKDDPRSTWSLAKPTARCLPMPVPARGFIIPISADC